MRNSTFVAQSVHRRLVLVPFSFVTAVGSNPSSVTDPYEVVASVTNVGGLYTVTFEQSYSDVYIVSARIADATVNQDIKATVITDGTSGSASTLLLQAYTPTTGLTLDLNAIRVEVLVALNETEDDP